jgi:hypothetical protein
MKLKAIVLFTLVGLLLAACTTAVTAPAAGERPAGERPAGERPAGERPAGERPAGEQTAGEQTVEAGLEPAESTGAWPTEAQTDQQGAVTVVVRPLNLAAPGATLDFEVILDTHSVDLSMNLAELATLTDGSGREVQATLWEAPLGGHHVSGTLSFPATTTGGDELLAGSSQITLIVRDVGVAERRFVWQK